MKNLDCETEMTKPSPSPAFPKTQEQKCQKAAIAALNSQTEVAKEQLKTMKEGSEKDVWLSFAVAVIAQGKTHLDDVSSRADILTAQFKQRFVK